MLKMKNEITSHIPLFSCVFRIALILGFIFNLNGITQNVSAATKNAESQTIKIKTTREFTSGMFDVTHKVTLQAEVTYVLEKSRKRSKTAKPYRGAVQHKGTNYVDPEWLDDTLSEIIDAFKKHYKGQEEGDFFSKLKLSSKHNYLLFYFKGFYTELSNAYESDAKFRDIKKLKADMQQKYLKNIGIYLAKLEFQKPVTNPYKLPPFVLKEMQPVLATVMYGDPFIALAEVYKFSCRFNKQTQNYYRGIFRRSQLLMTLRRSQQIPVDERYPTESLVTISGEHMQIYMSYHVVSWIEEEKLYVFSKRIEKHN